MPRSEGGAPLVLGATVGTAFTKSDQRALARSRLRHAAAGERPKGALPSNLKGIEP